MVNLAPSSRFKPGSIWRRQSQPCRATTSPMVKIFTCTPFLSDAGSGVIAEILYYIPVVITRMGLKFNTFATFEYSGAYRVLPVVYSFDKLCGACRAMWHHSLHRGYAKWADLLMLLSPQSRKRASSP